MFRITSSGSFNNTIKFLERSLRGDIYKNLARYGQLGVDALAKATPVESGLTARSWAYRVIIRRGYAAIEWYNTHVVDGVNVAIILQYGHGTGTGGFVSGIDYINPAIRPIFDQIADDVWKEVNT